MDFLVTLSRQPLFRLLGAIIVLVLVDQRPIVGYAAFAVWVLWIWWGSRPYGERIPIPK